MDSQRALPPLSQPVATQGTHRSRASSRFASDSIDSTAFAFRKQQPYPTPIQTRNAAHRTVNGKESQFLGVTWDRRHETWISELWNGQQYVFLGKNQACTLWAMQLASGMQATPANAWIQEDWFEQVLLARKLMLPLPTMAPV